MEVSKLFREEFLVEIEASYHSKTVKSQPDNLTAEQPHLTFQGQINLLARFGFTGLSSSPIFAGLWYTTFNWETRKLKEVKPSARRSGEEQ